MERHVYRRLGELEDRHWWFAARRRILGGILEDICAGRPGLDILEAGCGTGGNLAMLGGFGHLSAFEPDAEARLAAARKSHIPIDDARLPEGLPYGRGRFDLICAFDVIEHVEKDRESLAALGGTLKPGGRLVMTVPALPWLWSRHDEHHHHFRRYTRKSLGAALRAAGLAPVKISYFNTILFPMIAGVRLMGKLFGRDTASDDRMPPLWLNTLLERVFGLERPLLKRFCLPTGVSLLAVAERAP
jgi:SAM-dependent methyltransferase